MAEEVANDGKQLVVEQENTEHADQPNDQVENTPEDTEKLAQTTTESSTEPSTEQDEELVEVNDPDKVQGDTEQADQLKDQVENTSEDTEKQAETTTEPATEQDKESIEANDPDKAQGDAEQADQLEDQVGNTPEDKEKVAETTTEPSTGQDKESIEANDPDKAQGDAEQADQLEDQVENTPEDKEKVAETTTQPSTEQDKKLVEANGPDKAQGDTEQADQLEDQVKDASENREKQVETTTEPSPKQDEESVEVNVKDAAEAQDTPENKDMEESAADKAEESNRPATPSFPKTLEGFGYKFNEKGQLRQIESDEPFLFEVKEDKQYNQAHYEALGEVITEHIYQLLESDAGLTRTDIPVDVKSDEAHSFIFESPDARTADKLMIIIHGSGVVRAGQWSRRLIINDCLNNGTQLPFIKRSVENSYGVLVLNTNRNSDIVNGEELPVRGSESAKQHTEYVWDHVISKCAAKRIDIVAHSYGGVAVLHLVVERFAQLKDKVEKIAFTDSVHSIASQCQDLTSQHKQDITQWFSEHTINWISNDQPLDTVISQVADDAPLLSAGTTVHEETSSRAINSIFKYFTSKENYVQVITKLPEELVPKTEDEQQEPATTAEDEQEPVTKPEDEPVTKTAEVPATDIDKRIEESGHHPSKEFPEPENDVETCPRCVIV